VAATAGVDCPPEPATTVLAAGASARAVLRVGEQSLPPVRVHVAALLGAVLTAPSARLADGAGAAAVPAEMQCSRRPRRGRRRRQPFPLARRHGGLPHGKRGRKGWEAGNDDGRWLRTAGKMEGMLLLRTSSFFQQKHNIAAFWAILLKAFFRLRLRQSPWSHPPQCTGRLEAS